MNEFIKKPNNWIRNYFKFDQFNAIFKKELIGGISTFIAMAYILAVNPGMVSGANGAGEDLTGGLFLSTAIASFFATMFMGLYARIPVSLAPGMGLNAFFTYNIASQVGFESALSITILSGILYFLIVMTPARERIAKIMPNNLKLAIGTGIGFFVAFLGLQDTQIIVKDESSSLVSGIGNFTNPLVLVAVILLIVAFILHYAKVPGAILITMLLGGIILIPMIATGFIVGSNGENLSDTINPAIVGYNGFGKFGNVVSAAWKGFANADMWKNPITYIGALSFLYMDFFDTTGTLISIDKQLELSKKDAKWMSRANLVDAIGTIAGSSIGSTTVTAFVESTVGISAGAKTGLASIFSGMLFGLSIALWPILQIFMPINGFKPITGPILILVGTMMISQIKHFEWELFIDIPTLFVTIVFMMLSNSIALGIAFGTIIFVILNASLGFIQFLQKSNKKIVNSMEITTTSHSNDRIKTKEVNYLERINMALIVIAVISLTYIILEQGMNNLGWFS